MNRKGKSTKKQNPPKPKRTAAEKRAKRERRKKFETIFINGKQKRVSREPTIDGIGADEWILENADPDWLHQNEMCEYFGPSYFDDPQELQNDGGEGGESPPVNSIVSMPKSKIV